jgi:hypothetical protein
MPVRYVIDKESQLVVTTGLGRLTFAESLAHQDQLLNDPDFNSEFNQLIDLTAATSLDISVAEAKRLAMRNPFSSTSRRAFVATNPSIFGLGRLMEVYHEMSAVVSLVCVFYDLPSAMKWLGVDSVPY